MADAIPLPFEPEEAWRPVVGFEGVYEVSDQGRVKRVGKAARNSGGARVGRILKPQSREDGYLFLSLWWDGKGHRRSVHQLVARAFIGPCPAGHEVNHRDGVRSNCRATNLEYLTPSENSLHAWRVLLHAPVRYPAGEQRRSAKLTEQDAAEIRRRYVRGVYGAPKLAREFGVSTTSIRRIVTGKLWRETK